MVPPLLQGPTPEKLTTGDALVGSKVRALMQSIKLSTLPSIAAVIGPSLHSVRHQELVGEVSTGICRIMKYTLDP